MKKYTILLLTVFAISGLFIATTFAWGPFWPHYPVRSYMSGCDIHTVWNDGKETVQHGYAYYLYDKVDQRYEKHCLY